LCCINSSVSNAMTVKLHTLKEKEVRKDKSQDIPKISGLM